MVQYILSFLLGIGTLLAALACQEAPEQQTEAKAVINTLKDTIVPGRADKMIKDNGFMSTSAVPSTFARADENTLHYLMGQFEPSERKDFVKVGRPYSDKDGMVLRRETFEAFRKMWNAARKDGVMLNIISSTRNFDRQKAIWEGKWERFAADAPEPEARALKILEYSSMPGSSRHHWGTDIDLNDLENSSFAPGGKYANVYRWLSRHAQEYGFCQPYTEQDEKRPNGYHEEKWHWSYMPLSGPFLAQYKANISNEMIGGFKGAETARSIHIVENYVLGINPDCK
ncbi:MAG: M15 family metallopeptidase [Lewinellaceae bacterium]|nr:M15 family metallopeptidase [Lewinellaceae bacterium]